MSKRIAALLVIVELDDIPGTMHNEESAQEAVQQLLNDDMSHYAPCVYITDARVAPILGV
jgi:hypothetical protein